MQGRCGATAVEFALVCPIILAVMFGMIEISRMSTIVDAARTSVISGVREARVADASSASVEQEMKEVLDLFGIRESEISISPSVIGSDTERVTIGIDVPFNSNNGLTVLTLPKSRNMTLNIEVNRD